MTVGTTSKLHISSYDEFCFNVIVQLNGLGHLVYFFQCIERDLVMRFMELPMYICVDDMTQQKDEKK